MRISASLIALAACLSLGACATAPKSEIPDRAAASGPLVSANSAAFTPAEPEGEWWRLYADPALDGLVAQAMANNRDLAAAAGNLERVRALLSEARSGWLPSTTLTGGYVEGKTAQAQTAPGADREYEGYNAGFSAGWEVDVFGRVRNAVAAARADRDAAAAAYDLVRLTVAAETARAYADVCAANAQITVAERTLSLQDRTAGLTRTLLDAGRGTGLDVARADTVLQNTRAALPPLRAQRDGAVFRLAVLTGRAPGEADAAIAACAVIPQMSAPIPVGDGAGLIARRPDIRQAERNLTGAAARAGVATAALFPTITLGGQAANSAASFGGLNDDAGFSFSVGPLISWNFPNVLAARARMLAARAGTDVALAQFDQTVLTALRDTETALSAYANELDRRAALMIARDRAAQAQRLSQLRFDEGADSFLSLLDAQRTLAQSEAALIQSQALVTSYQIAVFQALGGGWED